MAIFQAQADKDWQDSPSAATPIMATDLEAFGRRSRDLRWMVPTGVTSIDEFDDDTLDPAWVRADGTGALAANATWTEKGDCLSLYQNGGDADTVLRGLLRPLSSAGGPIAAGDAFITCFDITGNYAVTNIFGGLLLTDSATHGTGKQVMAAGYGTNATAGIRFMTASGANWAMSTFVNGMDFRPGSAFLRLVCTGTSVWRLDVGPNGIDYIKGIASVTLAFTPTHIGFLSSSWNTATKGVVSYEFLRRVSGVS